MIELQTLEVSGFTGALKGMRNPYKSRAKSDTEFCNYIPIIGTKDMQLAMTLANSKKGSDKKFLRMIHVQVDIRAPLYWWKEMDQYKVATVTDSESTMHTIEKTEFTSNDFSVEHLNDSCQTWIETSTEKRFKGPNDIFNEVIQLLNNARGKYLENTTNKLWWWLMIQILPESYNQLRTWDGNYATLRAIYEDRANHKLNEWNDFRKWIESLPYAELITGDMK